DVEPGDPEQGAPSDRRGPGPGGHGRAHAELPMARNSEASLPVSRLWDIGSNEPAGSASGDGRGPRSRSRPVANEEPPDILRARGDGSSPTIPLIDGA